ncbi:MAG: FKBP-type peptidyl-prolyl cis-trans isomerase [Lysobacterales bacterium]|jgi:FKBP-type peptidyl-prolyl cis-trans isomerase
MRARIHKLVQIFPVVLAALLAASSAWAVGDAFRAGPDGLRYRDLQVGQGPVAATGMVATIHFIGWLDEQGARGKEIYNSRAEGRPVSFVIGTDGVMQAWNEGVIGMQPGGSRMLLVPPGLAYGNRAVDDVIPANASLMFRIELIRLDDSPDS